MELEQLAESLLELTYFERGLIWCATLALWLRARWAVSRRAVRYFSECAETDLYTPVIIG